MQKIFAFFEKDTWFVKYKLYHIPFWFVYHVIWWTITVGSLNAVANNILYSAYSIKFLFYVVFQAMGVYFNLYFLIPKFLHKGKYLSYIFFLLLTIVITTLCIVSGYYFSAYLSKFTFKELYEIDPSNFMEFFSNKALPSTVASMTLAMSVKLTKNWIQAEHKQKILEKEKLETELKFLKSQFNPHFLFNTINSIFVLIHKNQDLATESLAKFSDLLRYQLYECNEHFIPFNRELDYLKGFIELSKLRLNPKEVELVAKMPFENFNGLQIAPFILMPFIENAFKHVKKGELGDGKIDIDLKLSEHRLWFIIKNTKTIQATKSNDLIKLNGIGLENVKRRLALIYPGSHQLEINEGAEWFEVKLNLDLEQNLQL